MVRQSNSPRSRAPSLALDQEPTSIAATRVDKREPNDNEQRRTTTSNLARKHQAMKKQSTIDNRANNSHHQAYASTSTESITRKPKVAGGKLTTAQFVDRHDPNSNRATDTPGRDQTVEMSVQNDQRDDIEGVALYSKIAAGHSRTESIIEKRRRMVLYKERLKKKFGDDEQNESTLVITVPEYSKDSATQDDGYKRESNPSSECSTNERLEKNCSATEARSRNDDNPRMLSNGASPKTMQQQLRPKSRSRSRSRSRSQSRGRGKSAAELPKIGLPRPERPKLKSKESCHERNKAPSHISVYENVSSSGSSRQSSTDDMAAASTDPLMVYDPKSPRSQIKATQRNMQKIKKERQPVLVYESGDDDDYVINRVALLAKEKAFDTARPNSNSVGVAPKSSHGSLKIKSPPHGIAKDARNNGERNRNNGERNYTSFIATVEEKALAQKDLTELPSPQNRGLNAACEGSSLFSALTDMENEIDKEIPVASAQRIGANGQVSPENDGDLVLAASSSLFSFPSADSCDEQVGQPNATKVTGPRSNVPETPPTATTRAYTTTIRTDTTHKRPDGSKIDEDSLYAGLEEVDTVAMAMATGCLAPSTALKKRTPFSSVPSSSVQKHATPGERAAKRSHNVSPVKSNAMSTRDGHEDKPRSSGVLANKQLPETQRGPKKTSRTVKTLLPFLFRAKKRNPQPRKERSSNNKTISLPTANPDNSNEVLNRPEEPALMRPFSDNDDDDDDDDSKTMITVLENKDQDGTSGAIELMFSPTNSATCPQIETKPLAMAKARSSSSHYLQSPKLLRFPSLAGRARSAPLDFPKVVDGPVYNVRITLGYLSGVRRAGRGNSTRKQERPLVVGYAYLEETPSVAFFSSQTAESTPLTTTVNDSSSACNVVWSGKGQGDKTLSRLYFSVVQDNGVDNVVREVSLAVGVKMGPETIRLGTVSLPVPGHEIQGKLCTLGVKPAESSNQQSSINRFSARRARNELNRFSLDKEAHYMLDKDASLRIRVDIKEGEPGVPGPEMWGDNEDDDQSFVHSLYDLETADNETTNPPVLRQGGHNADRSADEHVASVEVVPLSNGATYISAHYADKRIQNQRLYQPPVVIEHACQPYHGFGLNPLLEHWNCTDVILEDEGSQSIDKDDDSVAARSTITGTETEIMIPPMLADKLDMNVVPSKGKKPFFGILRRRIKDTPVSEVQTSSRPAIEEISSPFFQLQVRSPKGGSKPNESLSPRRSVTAELPAEAEPTCEASVDGDIDESYQSQDGHSLELESRATSCTRSTRKSLATPQPAAMDRAAQWLIESLKGLVGNSSTDSDDHERQTTFSHSTGFDVRNGSDLSATISEDPSTFSEEHRPRFSKDKHVAVEQLYTAISGLSEVMSQDSDQGTTISKDVCEDLKRVLALARQLKMKPEQLIERIAAGDSIEKIVQENK